MSVSFIAAVKQSDGDPSSPGTTLTSASLNAAANDLLVASVCWLDGATTTVTLTDTSGNTWVEFPYGEAGTATAQNRQRAFYCLAPAANASLVVTATWGASRSYRRLIVHQARSTEGAMSYVANDAQVGNDVSSLSGFALNPSASGIVVSFHSTYNNVTLTAGSGFTKRLDDNNYLACQSAITSGSISVDADMSSSTSSLVVLAGAFREYIAPPSFKSAWARGSNSILGMAR